MSQRILITGGASGLGKAIALRFAQAGFKVCITDLNNERGEKTQLQLRALSSESFFHQASVTELAEWENLCELLKQRWGGVDVVVNNAGIAGSPGGVGQVTLEDWHNIIDINLLGVVRGCKTFSPVFMQQKSGYFINIASAAGLMNAPLMSSYNASKAAVISLSETLHTELAPYGVNVSVVCPSFFQTNLIESLHTTNNNIRDVVNKLMASSKLSADDIAELVYRAYNKKQFLILPHSDVRVSWLIKRYFPALFSKLMKKKTSKLLAVGRADQY